jgi:hypothetical protein
MLSKNGVETEETFESLSLWMKFYQIKRENFNVSKNELNELLDFFISINETENSEFIKNLIDQQ